MTKEEFITERTKIISSMLDNPDKHGIYPTTKCFNELDDLFDKIQFESEGRDLRSELSVDLMQYVTNLLYDALEQGFKLRHYAGIGEGFRNADTTEFDKWVEEIWEGIDEYLKQQPCSNCNKEHEMSDDECYRLTGKAT